MPKKIDVGGYRLAYEMFGSGQPTVVFECGIEDGSQSLISIARQLEPYAQVFLYDRAGLGESDPAPKPRTIEDAVNDLHTLLQRAKIPGPYVVVGHSYGGLIARHYASRHLQELKGLVLLDVPHPELPLRELALLPEPIEDELPALRAFRQGSYEEWHNPLTNQEGFDVAKSAKQVLANSHLGDLALVVVTAGLDTWKDGFPLNIARGLEEDWLAMQKEFLKLSSANKHIIATESYHTIQDYQPDLIVDIILQLLKVI